MFALIQAIALGHIESALQVIRNPKFWMVIIFDVFLLFLALYLSYYFRYEQMPDSSGMFKSYLAIFPLIISIKLPIFYFFGLYKGMWRYTSTADLKNIVKATATCITLNGNNG